MSTFTRWILPCNFVESKYQTDPIVFNFKSHVKQILSNEVWKRKFDYGFSGGLKAIEIEDIKNAKVIVFPKFIQGSVNENRIIELFEKYCGKLPEYLNLDNYKKWSYRNGFAIIEIEYVKSIDSLPIRKDFESYHPNWNEDFLNTYHQSFAVLKELKYFFLTCLHLTFPSSSSAMSNDNPLNDGLYQIKSKRRKYASMKSSSLFMHEVLIEKSRLSWFNNLSNLISEKWHYNLWPIKRYLEALKTNDITMDNLLDLIYSLEGLFGKNASSSFIKLKTILLLATSRSQANEIRGILDVAFRIRNDIAHGEKSYDLFDKIKVNGKTKLAQFVFWEMKTIVAQMLIMSLIKMKENPEMKNLRFNEDDFIALMFKE